MLSVSLSDALLDQIIRRVIFSSFTGALWVLIALAILNLLRVKNPAVKHVFYALALSKAFVALAREPWGVLENRSKISIGFQFPDPSGLPDFIPDAGTNFFAVNSSLAAGPGLVVLAIAIIFLLWRAAGLVRFYRIISGAPQFDRAGNEKFFQRLDRLVKEAGIAYPKIILLNSAGTPFTVGLKRPVIALSPPIMNQLDEDEVEAVLAHEIAHIARRDHFYHWPIVIMRDVLFFNPLTHFIYHRLSFERERACDNFSSKLCPPLTLAKGLVKIAEIRVAEPTLGVTRAFAPQSFLSKSESDFSRRVTELIKSKPYSPLSQPKRAFFWLGAFVFFYMEIHISALIGGTRLFLS